MNVLERAIESAQARLDKAKHNLEVCEWGRATNAKKIRQAEVAGYTLEVLLEQAEREKGCVWCQHHTHLFNKIYELNAVLPVVCPWCGRKLENQP